jgi:hypothetical protein
MSGDYMEQNPSQAFSILESSILSKPRMMGTPAEQETTRYILNFLKAAGLSPFTEDFQWSNAYVVARKVLALLFIPWLIVFNISTRVEGLSAGILSISMPILAILLLILSGRAVLNDRFSYLGVMSAGKNVICDLASRTEKEQGKTVIFTAHTDSVGSSMPRLNIPLLLGSIFLFLISIIMTFAGGVVLIAGTWTEGFNLETFNLILLGVSTAAGLMIITSSFARRVNTSPGAIDNGSGTAILLSLAEYFQGEPPEHTSLRFIFCAAEEWGLYGSKGYVKAHQDELEEYITRDVVINVDMVGSELAFLNKAGLIIKKPLNKDLNNLICATAEKEGIEVRAFNTPFAGNSDHAPFRKLKMETAFFLSKKDTKYIHKSKDTLEKVDPQKMEDAVLLLKAIVNELDQE